MPLFLSTSITYSIWLDVATDNSHNIQLDTIRGLLVRLSNENKLIFAHFMAVCQSLYSHEKITRLSPLDIAIWTFGWRPTRRELFPQYLLSLLSSQQISSLRQSTLWWKWRERTATRALLGLFPPHIRDACVNPSRLQDDQLAQTRSLRWRGCGSDFLSNQCSRHGTPNHILNSWKFYWAQIVTVLDSVSFIDHRDESRDEEEEARWQLRKNRT